MFEFQRLFASEPSLDLRWVPGEVNDWWLSVGRSHKLIHIYTNPWSPLWIAEGPVFGLDRETFTTASEAKLQAELVFRDWLRNTLYNDPSDLIIFSTDDSVSI